MIRPLAGMVLAGFVLLALCLHPASAAESYDNCTGFIDSVPAVITTQGTWCLRKDLSTGMVEGNAIEIATNNVTLDCNDFKIGGLGAGLGTLAVGVHASSRFNIGVRNCRIRGFRIGISMEGLGGGHRIEENVVEQSRSLGMFIAGAGSIVRSNRVVDSGGSSRSALAVEAGIQVVLGVDVIDNRVRGVRPPSGTTRSPAGIYALNNNGGSIIGNRIGGLVPSGSTRAVGIRATANDRSTIMASGNILSGTGAQTDTGILCEAFGSGASNAISVDNVLVGFSTPVSACSPGDNTVNSF